MTAEANLSELFQGPEHAGFAYENGDPAALLVHGFLGTPAEMRPLAEHLLQAGWTVEAPLLPGFGPELERLFETGPQAWVQMVRERMERLRSGHRQVLLLGYSLGAAIALHAHQDRPADGLLLAAPFWRTDGGWISLFWPVLKQIFREMRPFRSVNFEDPRMQEGLQRMLPGVDLGDQATRQALRNVRVPSGFIDSLVRFGAASREIAGRSPVPALVLQGVRDQVITPRWTRRLIQEFRGPVCYFEVQADHQLLSPESSDLPRIVWLIGEFARQLERQNG